VEGSGSEDYEPSITGSGLFGNDQQDLDLLLSPELEGDDEQGDFGFEFVGDVSIEPPVSDDAEPSRQSQSSEVETVCGAAWNTLLSNAFASVQSVDNSLLLPWETGTMKAIFSNDFLPDMLQAPRDFADLDQLGHIDAAASKPKGLELTVSSSMPAYMSAVRCLKDLDYIDAKRAKMSLAATQWMEILSLDWKASQVGDQVAMDLQADATGELAEESLRAVFGTTSASTVLKRAASLRQYIAWFHKTCIESDTFLCPLPLQEEDVWRYFLHLRATTKTSKRGYTVSSTFLETVRFCKFVIGLYSSDKILASKRLLGFAAVERREKGPLVQAPPLEVEHLQKLHAILESGSNVVDRIGAGAFLCAIYARARWSDMRYIHHIRYNGYKRNATMDLYTAEHKTSLAGLRREQFLPLVIPSEGIVHGDWLGIFIQLCYEQGTDWEKVPCGPLLPAPKIDGGWCIRPLSTGEAAAWLRKLLEGCSGVEHIRAHSMKVTLCVWAARAGFSKEHRATLSHHATALDGSDVVYSRELQTGAIRKLQMLLKKIRVGLDPRSEQLPLEEITAPFESTHVSNVRTPNFDGQAPSTPLPEVVAQPSAVAQSFQECKKEKDLGELCVRASADDAPFGESIQTCGLIQIDSSSGSDSSSSSSDDSDDSSSEHFANALPAPVFTETVPEGFNFFVHTKSKIMHRAKSGADKATCKVLLNSNFKETERTFHFKYPKCMKCFARDHNRLKNVSDVVKTLDESAKRRKMPEP